MQPEDHRRKASRLERSLDKLDDGADYEMIIEACYAAAVQQIATISDKRRRKHLDTHKGLAKFLDDNDLVDLAAAFRQLELLRTTKYYGGKGDGKSAKEAKRILEEIKSQFH